MMRGRLDDLTHMGIYNARGGKGSPPLSQELEDIDPSTGVSPSHWEVTSAPQQLPSGTLPPAPNS